MRVILIAAVWGAVLVRVKDSREIAAVCATVRDPLPRTLIVAVWDAVLVTPDVEIRAL